MYLDRKNTKILQCFMKNKGILTLDQLQVLTNYTSTDLLECLVFLWKNKFIRIVNHDNAEYLPMDGRFQITMEGKLYLDQRPQNLVLTWAPLLFSVIAIIISIVALVD